MRLSITKSISNSDKKWKEALIQCLLSRPNYEKYSRDVTRYFLNGEAAKIEIFLVEIEQSLVNKESSNVTKLCSLMLLRDGSEKKVRAFPEALAQRKSLYSAVYRIAVTEPDDHKSKFGSERFFAHTSGQSGTNGNESIRLAIECIVYWRLNFGGFSGTPGKIFRGLSSKLFQNDVRIPRKLTFFNQASERAIQNLERTIENKKEEDLEEISLDENSSGSANSRSEANQYSDEERSNPEKKRADFSQLKAMLTEMRKMKAEENKLYVQKGLFEKPNELREHFVTFLSKMKQTFESVKKNAEFSPSKSSNHDERRLIDDFAKEQENLQTIEESLKRNPTKFDLEDQKRILEYLYAQPTSGNSEKILPQSPLNYIGTVNEPKIPSFGTLSSPQFSPGNDTISLTSLGTRTDLGFLMQSISAVDSQKNSQTNSQTSSLTSPDERRSLQKIFNFSTLVEERSPEPLTIPLKRLHHIPEDEDEIDSPTPVFRNKIVPRFSLNNHESSFGVEANVHQDGLRKDSFDPALFKPKITEESESGCTSKTRETPSTFQSPADSSPKTIKQSTVPKLSAVKLHKELAEIAKSIQISGSRSKITRGSAGNKSSLITPRANISHKTSLSISAMNTDRQLPNSSLLNVVQAIQELKTVTSTLQEDNFRLKKELEELKSSVRRGDEGEIKAQSVLTVSSNDDEYPYKSFTERQHKLSNSECNIPQQHNREKSLTGFSEFNLNHQLQGNNGAQNDPLEFLGNGVSHEVRKTYNKHSNRRNRITTNSISSFIGNVKPSEGNGTDSNSSNSRIAGKFNLLIDTNSDTGTEINSLSTQQHFESKKIHDLDTEPEFAFPNKATTMKNSRMGLKLDTSIPKLSSISHSTTIQRIKPSLELRKIASTPKTASRTSFKVGEHPIFNSLIKKFDSKEHLDMLKRTTLLLAGSIFENDILKVTTKIVRLEDIDKERRLARVYLIFENKTKMHIQNLSIEIGVNSALLLIRNVELRKDYIKPGQHRQVDFVVGVGTTHIFSHLELDCRFEQVTVHKEGNPLHEFTLIVPVTYLNFMEGLKKPDDADLSFAWSSKSALVLQSSGKFKVNKEITQSSKQLLEFFPFATKLISNDPDKDAFEQKEAYQCILETEQLGVFIYARIEWFPNTEEIVVQIASAAEDDQKSAFLIQTLKFLFTA